MKLLIILLALVVQAGAQVRNARGYYIQLVRANGLEGITDEFVCFNDDQTDTTFWTFSKSEDLKRLMEAEEFPSRITKGFNGHFLWMLQYDKGIAADGIQFLDKDPTAVTIDSYTTKNVIAKGMLMRIRFNINWNTLRFKRSVEKANGDELYAIYGECENRIGSH